MCFFATASFAAAAAPSREVSDRDEASAAVARVPARAAGPRSAAGVAVGHLCGRFERANRIWLQALQISSPPRRAPHACEFCTVGPRPRARQILRHWRRTGGYIWVRARKCGGQLEARFHFACVRHSGGGAASGLDQGLVTAYSAARRSHVFIARSHVAQCGRDGIVWLCFWPRGDPRASARNPSSRCAGVAGMTLPDLTRTFFFVF